MVRDQVVVEYSGQHTHRRMAEDEMTLQASPGAQKRKAVVADGALAAGVHVALVAWDTLAVCEVLSTAEVAMDQPRLSPRGAESRKRRKLTEAEDNERGNV